MDSPVGTPWKVNDFEHPRSNVIIGAFRSGFSLKISGYKKWNNGITILIINNKDLGLCTYKDLIWSYELFQGKKNTGNNHICCQKPWSWSRPIAIILPNRAGKVWHTPGNSEIGLQDGAPKIAFSCLISGRKWLNSMVYGRYNYNIHGFINQLITGGGIIL